MRRFLGTGRGNGRSPIAAIVVVSALELDGHPVRGSLSVFSRQSVPPQRIAVGSALVASVAAAAANAASGEENQGDECLRVSCHVLADPDRTPEWYGQAQGLP